jgi:hypothetical protein
VIIDDHDDDDWPEILQMRGQTAIDDDHPCDGPVAMPSRHRVGTVGDRYVPPPYRPFPAGRPPVAFDSG